MPEKNIEYLISRKPRNNGTKTVKINEKMPSFQSKPLSFTIDNLENVLLEQFQEIAISENEWSKKQGLPSYDISVNVHGKITMEQIKTYLLQKFQQQPVGGHRNYASLRQANLFLYYRTGKDTFYLKFFDVLVPSDPTCAE